MTATINNHSLAIIEYQDQRVITLADVDRVHERADGTARRNFNSNREHFIIGEDYFEVLKKELSTNFVRNSKGRGNPNILMILLTETGYLMLVKSFTDDLAWRVQRELVKSYFKTTQQSRQLQSPNPLLEQNILDLKHNQSQIIENTLENSYFISEIRDKLENLESNAQFNLHTFELMRQAIESINQRLYKQEKTTRREHELFKRYIHGSDQEKRIASTLLLDNKFYREWVKQSVIQIASARQLHTNTVYKDLYRQLRTNPETADTMKMWETALEQDNGLLYKTYNLFSDRQSRGKIIHNLMDAIVMCGVTNSWELKDWFTRLVVNQLCSNE